VIAADIEPVREICGDAPLFFDPGDFDELARRISKVVQDDTLRRELVRNGFVRARDFTWERTARSTLQMLRAAVAARRVST
jgi:glycosyltransferase involved in cell wall biosynthesis